MEFGGSELNKLVIESHSNSNLQHKSNSNFKNYSWMTICQQYSQLFVDESFKFLLLENAIRVFFFLNNFSWR